MQTRQDVGAFDIWASGQEVEGQRWLIELKKGRRVACVSTPTVATYLFFDKHREHSNIGGRLKKKREEPGEQAQGTRVLRPWHHLVLGFFLSFFVFE